MHITHYAKTTQTVKQNVEYKNTWTDEQTDGSDCTTCLTNAVHEHVKRTKMGVKTHHNYAYKTIRKMLIASRLSLH